MTSELTPNAIKLGLDAALPARLEFAKREFGRGERSRTFMSDVQVIRFVEHTKGDSEGEMTA